MNDMPLVTLEKLLKDLHDVSELMCKKIRGHFINHEWAYIADNLLECVLINSDNVETVRKIRELFLDYVD